MVALSLVMSDPIPCTFDTIPSWDRVFVLVFEMLALQKNVYAYTRAVQQMEEQCL